MKKQIHKPPSRIKYDANNPTVSIRVSREMYDQLKKLREMSGKSLGDILREALKQQSPSAKRAFSLGYSSAQAKYGVWFNCSVCGGSIVIEDPNTKKAVAGYLKEHKWGHAKCVNGSS